MITPTRNFNLTYILLDSAFVIGLLALLLVKKEYRTVIFALFGGIIYYIADLGFFYGAFHSREVYINGELQGLTNTALVLLWMSLSYGITNFAFIWLCLKRDAHLFLWLGLIVGWWLICPIISMAGGENNIMTYRTTGPYHWMMALMFAAGYLVLIIYDLFTKGNKVNLLYLFIVGFLVQFFWEGMLLLTGIRPSDENSFMTLLIDSLLETNLGMPYIYLIYKFVHKKFGPERDEGGVLKRVTI